jgi:hypothetical protein
MSAEVHVSHGYTFKCVLDTDLNIQSSAFIRAKIKHGVSNCRSPTHTVIFVRPEEWDRCHLSFTPNLAFEAPL